MPGMYAPGEYDLVGTIIGVVDKAKSIDGSKIKVGDAVIGLASNGLHTNGYTLARKVLFDDMKLKLTDKLEGVTGTVGDELMRVHKNYQPTLAKLPHGLVKGLAHITGGGLVDNFPRVLPKTVDALIDTAAWKVPAIFQHIEKGGGVDHAEMYQVFNMGIGMCVVVAEKDVKAVTKVIGGKVIGRIERGAGIVRLK
jgi:phosphoribosylformylglycinamidine cyclo-ligase